MLISMYACSVYACLEEQTDIIIQVETSTKKPNNIHNITTVQVEPFSIIKNPRIKDTSLIRTLPVVPAT